jgi:imidazolonepropionase-like amidohydrolase
MKTKYLFLPSKLAFLFLSFFVWILVSGQLNAQTAPVIGLHKNVPAVHAIINVDLVIKPGTIIKKANLIIRDGYIESVGVNAKIPSDAVVHDMHGKTIYPGFIDLYTNFGIKADTQKNQQVSNNKAISGVGFWNSNITPEVKVIDQLVQDKVQSQKLRKLGFTTVVSFPKGMTFQGQGSHLLLNDASPKNAILQTDVLQSLNLTQGIHSSYAYYQKYPASLMGNIAMIRQALMDAKWYVQAWSKYMEAPNNQVKPEVNRALDALVPIINKEMPLIVKADDEYDLGRIDKIANEFGIETWIIGSGFDYRKIAEFKNSDQKIILPLNFPTKPKIASAAGESNISLRDLRHYEMAPYNSAKLNAKGFELCITSAFLKKDTEFLSNLRKAVNAGLDKEVAIAALTTNPSKWLGIDHLLGSLEKGKLANFIITDGDLFNVKTKIMQSWIAGKKFVIVKEDLISGVWLGETKVGNKKLQLDLKLKGVKIEGEVKIGKKTRKISSAEQKGESLNITLADATKKEGYIRLSATLNKSEIIGIGKWADGKSFSWTAKRNPQVISKTPIKKSASKSMDLKPLFPEGIYGLNQVADQNEEVLIKNASIWTSADQGVLKGYDMLVKDGIIAKIGKNLEANESAIIIDATDKHVSAGIIDPHAHISAKGNINEYSHAITTEVRMGDILIDDDINVYYQLAGGVTTVCTLHGSANPIAGLSSVIKLKWGENIGEMLVPEATEIMKFALGENVKSPNPIRGQKSRYPQSRMGTIEIMKDAFNAATDYRKEWEKYTESKKTNKNLIAPRKVIKYEHLLGVLDGKTMVHCHAYRHDEILAFMKLAEEFGFTVGAFIHTVEGYKVASEIKDHGAMAIVFGDWWAYKMEAYDGTPYNAAILHNAGVITSYHSDSQDVARRLNTEATKAMHYGDVSATDAIKFVTINAAKMLKLESTIGSLEVGKDADFVIWSGSPLSTSSICEQTWIEGKKYFDLKEDKVLKKRDDKQRNEIIQHILSANK